MAIPDALIHKNLQSKDTLIAYHKGDQYCERVRSAKIDLHNAKHKTKNSMKIVINTITILKLAKKCKNPTADMQCDQ